MKLDRMKMEHQLKDAGVPDVQATAHAKVYGEMQEELATKDDIVAVRADIDSVKGDIVAVKADIVAIKADIVAIKADIAAVKSDVADMKADILAVKADVAGLKANMDANRVYLEGVISQSAGKIIMWVTGIQIATIGIALTLVLSLS